MDSNIFSPPAYHTQEITVHSYEIDFGSKLNIFSLFNYFQEIAWEHAGLLHFGLDDLAQKNLFWVLSRVRVEIVRFPAWTEKIKLVTYPRGIDGLFALRDYEVYDSNNQRIIAGSSSWLILNAQTRRPVRLSDIGLPFVSNERCALAQNPSKIADVSGSPILRDNVIVKPSDFDVNYHVNNTRYIEWAYNAFNFQHHKEKTLKTVEVNFLAEGKEDYNLNINLYQLNEQNHHISINRFEDNKELCRVWFEWR